MTQTGMVMGTAQYIAPEQALGQDASPSSDVYSLGVVGYEAVSGKRPFTGDGALTVAMKHIKEPPPPLPAELPPNVRELIEITLVKNPGLRYRSGGPFADAVAAVRAGRRPPRPSQSPPPAGLPGSHPVERTGADRARAHHPDDHAAPNPARDGRTPAATVPAYLLLGPARVAVGRRGVGRTGDHHRGAHRHQFAGRQPATVTAADRHPDHNGSPNADRSGAAP
ncbi:putative serine/threonine-protein kinase pknA [Mycobacterium ulcerans str. Harvey]|uniref:Serine/threonine-protein kinase pknA n=1 Tax=Mycobacterium ulcerans str. Harvey TaxID=1299332 RepID=A0ABN0R8H8_MYCUL|nr:putative serine/threonine-protein kinase pknA [Mycobacterium ulcerans str. Harvey]